MAQAPKKKPAADEQTPKEAPKSRRKKIDEVTSAPSAEKPEEGKKPQTVQDMIAREVQGKVDSVKKQVGDAVTLENGKKALKKAFDLAQKNPGIAAGVVAAAMRSSPLGIAFSVVMASEKGQQTMKKAMQYGMDQYKKHKGLKKIEEGLRANGADEETIRTVLESVKKSRQQKANDNDNAEPEKPAEAKKAEKVKKAEKPAGDTAAPKAAGDSALDDIEKAAKAAARKFFRNILKP